VLFVIAVSPGEAHMTFLSIFDVIGKFLRQANVTMQDLAPFSSTFQERVPVGIIPKNLTPFVSPAGNVIIRPFILHS
jgi:hypothetical protein